MPPSWEMARLFHRHPGGEDLPLADLPARDAGAGPIDPAIHHTALPVLIAEVRDGAFQILHRRPAVMGDPYLIRPERLPEVRSSLRVIR